MSENLTLEKKNMYICPKCGMENDPDAKFCSQCGKTMRKPTHKVCWRCRMAYPTEEKFCKKCGLKLKERYRTPKGFPKLSPWINKGIVLAVAFALILCIFLPCFHSESSYSSFELPINSIEFVLASVENEELRTVANVLIVYFVYVALLLAFTVYHTLQKKSNGLVYKIISWLTLVVSPVLLLVVYMKGMDDLNMFWSRVGIYNGIMVAIIILCFINIFASLICKLIKKLSIQYPMK
jgi:ribosomal protein L40E